MFSLIHVWINGWANNREAGDLRRHRGHYDVIVMTGDLGQEPCWRCLLCWGCPDINFHVIHYDARIWKPFHQYIPLTKELLVWDVMTLMRRHYNGLCGINGSMPFSVKDFAYMRYLIVEKCVVKLIRQDKGWINIQMLRTTACGDRRWCLKDTRYKILLNRFRATGPYKRWNITRHNNNSRDQTRRRIIYNNKIYTWGLINTYVRPTSVLKTSRDKHI